ncbi:hypothetical protein PspLS_00103 [Pyricularia sp. CBS 133598]|nr:hypothetical protein PspLS_00103 [Pyricularia sp. CBS 133598]
MVVTIAQTTAAKETQRFAAEKDGQWISPDATALLTQRHTLLQRLIKLTVEYPKQLGEDTGMYGWAYYGISLKDNKSEGEVRSMRIWAFEMCC